MGITFSLRVTNSTNTSQAWWKAHTWQKALTWWKVHTWQSETVIY
jgi:hypothetical protein